jgi:hypothetical protein
MRSSTETSSPAQVEHTTYEEFTQYEKRIYDAIMADYAFAQKKLNPWWRKFFGLQPATCSGFVFIIAGENVQLPEGLLGHPNYRSSFNQDPEHIIHSSFRKVLKVLKGIGLSLLYEPQFDERPIGVRDDMDIFYSKYKLSFVGE